MTQLNTVKFLQKDPSFKLDIRSILFFAIAAFAAWALNGGLQMFFRVSSKNWFWTDTTTILLGDILLVYATYYLLKRNGLSVKVLGLDFSRRSFSSVLIGIVIGIVVISVSAVVSYLGVTYHFEYKSLSIIEIIKSTYSILLRALSEELLFRGFLLVVFAKRFGWRWAVLIMALPFGLFHLQGGPNVSMVISTTFYSLVFSLSFILTRSLWCAVFVHATVNLLLHVITGLDGASNSVYELVLDEKWPSYPLGLLVSIVAALITSGFLYIIIATREKRVTKY